MKAFAFKRSEVVNMKNLNFFLIFLILFQSNISETSATDFDVVLKNDRSKKIIIFGAGYVGSVTGACLSKMGHEITFIDPDQTKIAVLKDGRSPVAEPNIEELLKSGIKLGLIHAQEALKDELFKADIAMIAVQTPANSDNTPRTEYIENVLEILQKSLREKAKPLIICIRSTIPPTLIRELHRNYFGEGNQNVALVVNPEFLRETTAIHDFFNPPFCIAGGDNIDAINTILSLYEEITPYCIGTSLETASLLKYASNAFHATKIAFANEMASLSESIGVNPTEMMTIFCQDKILNCSAMYLKPGFSFGGSCLEKDLHALVSLGNAYHNSLPLLSSLIPSNEARFQKKTEEILKGNHQNLAVIGLTFKKNSDDLRESPFLRLIDRLKIEGIRLRLYDPDLKESSKGQLNDLLPFFYNDIDSALEGCDGVVICKDVMPKEIVEELKNQSMTIYNLCH